MMSVYMGYQTKRIQSVFVRRHVGIVLVVISNAPSMEVVMRMGTVSVTTYLVTAVPTVKYQVCWWESG